MKIRIGCDPEVFIRNPNSGQFLSAHGRIPGTKYAPHPVPHGAIQVDGMALEFNIDPADTVDEFYRNITEVRKSLQARVPGFQLVATPVADFDQSVIDEQPEEALELGCEPDYCAWTGAENARPDNKVNFRSGAGHIHIGWTEGVDVRSINHMADCVAMAKQMDYYLGIYSLLWDPDNRRRSLYGKAGAFRVKPYGMEYRTMSNAWLNDDRLIRWVYHAAVTGAEQLAKGNRVEDNNGSTAQKIIDENITDWPNLFEFGLPISRPPGLKDQLVS